MCFIFSLCHPAIGSYALPQWGICVQRSPRQSRRPSSIVEQTEQEPSTACKTEQKTTRVEQMEQKTTRAEQKTSTTGQTDQEAMAETET
ncbi:hypothetical protein ROHU_012913 [Labeo rohita]|uniref:Uncharacterized protein n=1 Tax=Labeo rohita TaxID=84645 RepID=A0A498L8H9_LABRO|nr:hypothetical protein ROHU_012913 [Labeo rohita]